MNEAHRSDENTTVEDAAHHPGGHEHTPVEPTANGQLPAGKMSHGHMSAGHMSGHGHMSGGGMGSMAEAFRQLFWRNLVLAIPVAVASSTVQGWFGYSLDFPGADWIAPIFGTIIYFYGGRPFLTGAVSELKDSQPGMMTLISLAITTAYVSSMLTSLGVLDLDFWWELAGLIVIMLLGHWQEMKAVGQASGALDALAKMLPETAELVKDDGSTESIPLDKVAVGDRLLVRAGARVPADGKVVDGTADIDESMLTGESKPVTKTGGDKVVGGSIATDSSITVEISAVGDDTALGGIRHLVANAQKSKSRTQTLADRAAKLLFYVAVAAAIITFIVWNIVSDMDHAIARMVTVLVIACPHALGLAIPLVTSISTAKAAKVGILVADQRSLETMRLVDTVLMDKTGTLTVGKPAVTSVHAVDGGDADRVLSLAAAAESHSEHPLAKAITARADERSIDVPDASDISTEPGKGVHATVDGAPVAVGGPNLLADEHLELPDDLTHLASHEASNGATVMSVICDNKLVGIIGVEDEIRPTSAAAVAALEKDGVSVSMITGDAAPVAHHVADQLGIGDVHAGVLPEDKHNEVAKIQQGGDKVAMVGDGVNDAPALAQADVGLAIGAGTDVAIQSAGIVLASSDPRNVVGVIKLSKASYRKMVQNLWWAAGYNIISIPLAAGVLAPWGFVMPPWMGAITMSLSTIIVSINAETLHRLDLDPDHLAPA